MKKQILFIAIFFVFASGAFAQTAKAVRMIDVRYGEVSAMAKACESDSDQGEFGGLVMNTLTINSRSHQWRAVGIYGQTYKFFYKGGDTEEHMYPDQLVYVVVERRVSDRSYREEYLFSDAGALMFCLQTSENDDAVPKSRRIYFTGPKAIRIIEGAKTRDTLTAADTKDIAAVLKTVAGIKQIFSRSISL